MVAVQVAGCSETSLKTENDRRWNTLATAKGSIFDRSQRLNNLAKAKGQICQRKNTENFQFWPNLGNDHQSDGAGASGSQAGK